MRFVALFMVFAGLFIVVAGQAGVRPPFFVRYVDVKNDQQAHNVLVADLVNPRSSSVLLRAYVRASGAQKMLERGRSLDMEIALPNVLMKPASRQSVHVALSDLPEREGEVTY